MSSHNLDFIILSDGHGSNTALLSQVERREDTAFLQMWEVPLTVLAPVGSHGGVELHFVRWRSTMAANGKSTSL